VPPLLSAPVLKEAERGVRLVNARVCLHLHAQGLHLVLHGTCCHVASCGAPGWYPTCWRRGFCFQLRRQGVPTEDTRLRMLEALSSALPHGGLVAISDIRLMDGEPCAGVHTVAVCPRLRVGAVLQIASYAPQPLFHVAVLLTIPLALDCSQAAADLDVDGIINRLVEGERAPPPAPTSIAHAVKCRRPQQSTASCALSVH